MKVKDLVLKRNHIIVNLYLSVGIIFWWEVSFNLVGIICWFSGNNILVKSGLLSFELCSNAFEIQTQMLKFVRESKSNIFKSSPILLLLTESEIQNIFWYEFVELAAEDKREDGFVEEEGSYFPHYLVLRN